MALYSYKAINNHGKTSKGLQDAANVVDLELRLKRNGLDLISARVSENKATFGIRKIQHSDLITFFFNLDQFRLYTATLECHKELTEKISEVFGKMKEDQLRICLDNITKKDL